MNIRGSFPRDASVYPPGRALLLVTTTSPLAPAPVWREWWHPTPEDCDAEDWQTFDLNGEWRPAI